MTRYGIPEKFIAIDRSFHEGMLARVLDEGESSKPSRSQMSSNQVACWPPTLFSVVFSAMLKTAFLDDTDSMAIRYRTDGKLLKLRRRQATLTQSHTYMHTLKH